jgi:hypothetical protein
MVQIVLGVAVITGGVESGDPYRMATGVGFVDVGLLNYFGGLFEGPNFVGPLTPEMDRELWLAWVKAQREQQQKNQAKSCP